MLVFTQAVGTEELHESRCRRRKRCGKGLVNHLINALPFELHLPGYQYCGPGTKLEERLARGDPGINPLDAACKEHDIAYSKYREDLAARREADGVLADRAWKRVFTKDASLAEKAAAWSVANAMNLKTKLGMGVRKIGRAKKKKKNMVRKKKQSVVPLKTVVEAAARTMRPSENTRIAVASALRGARDAVKKVGGKRNVRTPRLLPLPKKIGGFLPFLVPLFAGLSATGALAGGAAGIAKAVNDASTTKRQLEEMQRHNRTIEAVALGKGLYLKPYKKGLGLHLQPYSKNG